MSTPIGIIKRFVEFLTNENAVSNNLYTNIDNALHHSIIKIIFCF